MTKSIDKRLEALDVLVKLLSQINVKYEEIENEHRYFTFKLEDPYDDPYTFIITRDELDALKEVIDNMKGE